MITSSLGRFDLAASKQPAPRNSDLRNVASNVGILMYAICSLRKRVLK
jgi:hypothetical protein